MTRMACLSIFALAFLLSAGTASGENADHARKLNPIFERDDFGKKILTFEGIRRSPRHSRRTRYAGTFFRRLFE